MLPRAHTGSALALYSVFFDFIAYFSLLPRFSHVGLLAVYSLDTPGKLVLQGLCLLFFLLKMFLPQIYSWLIPSLSSSFFKCGLLSEAFPDYAIWNCKSLLLFPIPLLLFCTLFITSHCIYFIKWFVTCLFCLFSDSWLSILQGQGFMSVLFTHRFVTHMGMHNYLSLAVVTLNHIRYVLPKYSALTAAFFIYAVVRVKGRNGE